MGKEDPIFGVLSGTEPEPGPEEEEKTEPREEEGTGSGPQQSGHLEQDVDSPTPLLAGKYKSAEELERAHAELESRLGKQGQDLARMRQYNEQLLSYLYQMYPNQIQAPASAPSQSPEIDPVQWVEEELYKKGPQAVESLIQKHLHREGEQLGVVLNQVLTPLYQHMQMQQATSNLYGQLTSVNQKYGDVRNYANDMMQIVQENPHMLSLPNSMEVAYLMARQRSGGVVPSGGAGQGTQAAVKKAARVPGSRGSNVPPDKSPEDIIKESIFGPPGGGKGMFG